MGRIPHFTASDLASRMTPSEAVEAIETAMFAGVDVEADIPRVSTPVSAGELLTMPAEQLGSIGIKLLSVARANTSRGVPAIQGFFVLFDPETLSPQVVIDGAWLTALRTPAVSTVAIRHLLRCAPSGPRSRIEHLLVFGSGTQAEHHIRTVSATMPVDRVTIRARNEVSVRSLIDRLEDDGIAADVAKPDAHRDADVIITATSSHTPVLLESRPDAVIAAIGAHGIGKRELSVDLMRRADVVVESRASALQESGNVISAGDAAFWAGRLINLRELVTNGIRRRPDRPAVFSGVGMSWEDLVIASRLFEPGSELFAGASGGGLPS